MRAYHYPYTMVLAIFTSRLDTGAYLAEALGLGHDAPNSTPRITVYRHANRILLAAEDHPGLATELFAYAEETFGVVSTLFFSIGASLGNEICIGDVILPHTFIRADDHVEKGETAHTQHMTVHADSAIFLPNYTFQSDYDFQTFGLSVGGICISAPQTFDADNLDRFRTHYAGDVLDHASYAFVREAEEHGALADHYVVCAMAAGPELPTPPLGTPRDRALRNGASIVRFVAESMEGKDFSEIIETPETDGDEDS